MCKKQKHYYGCIQSKLDGTEHVANVDEKLQLPEEFDLRKIMPPVRNQGNTQTCVCQSLTGVLDVLYNEANDQTAVCNNFSISELYNSRSNKPQEGMCFKDALKYLRRKGLKGFKINSYALVPSVDALKRCLVMFGPCVCGFPVYTDNDPYFWRKGKEYGGGHAVTIVGYNKKGFVIRNSWGSSWAEKGYITIPYKDYEDTVFECWTITL